MLPVLAVDLISSQGVVKHQDFVGVLQSWSGVLAVLQLHSSIEQREVPPDDQSIRTVCGGEAHRKTPDSYFKSLLSIEETFLKKRESDSAVALGAVLVVMSFTGCFFGTDW